MVQEGSRTLPKPLEIDTAEVRTWAGPYRVASVHEVRFSTLFTAVSGK